MVDIFNKRIFFVYSLIVLFLSAYINKSHVNLHGFVFFTIIIFSCFIGIYFLIKNFNPSSNLKKILIIGAVLLLLFAIYVSGIFSSLSGFNSASCYNINAENIFTGTEKTYCNFPPWYTTVTSIELGDGDGKISHFLLGGNLSVVCERYNYDALQRYCERKIN